MKNNLLKLLLLCLSLPVCAEVAVIVHPSNSNVIDEAFIKKAFTGKIKSFGNGDSVIAINQENGNKSVEEFNEKLLNKSSSQLKAYWSKQIFTGKGTPPKELSNNDEVIKLVSTNPNLIGYIDSTAINSTVKVVGKY